MTTDHSRALRIAFLTPEYVSEPKFDGGLANYLSRVTKLLQEEGHFPEVFVLSDHQENLEHQGIPIHRVQRKQALRDLRFRKVLNRATGIRLDVTVPLRAGARGLADALLRRHSEEPFDIVQGSDYGATGLFIPRRRDFSFVTRLSYFRPLWREMMGVERTTDRRLAEYLECRSVQRSDRCYGPSSRIAEVVRREMNVSVDVLRPPVPHGAPDSPEDESVWQSQLQGKSYVLFFGRVCPIKGADLLARAMRTLLEQDETLHLVIIGREDPEGYIDELRQLLGAAAKRMIHIGRLPHSQLFPIIRHAQAVALPSRIDNFPNVCIEAMRLGQVVIGTREASFDELIDDGQNGFLASTASVESITSAIQQALGLTGEQRRAMGNAAQTQLKRFHPEATIPALCDFYRQVIDGRDHGTSLNFIQKQTVATNV